MKLTGKEIGGQSSVREDCDRPIAALQGVLDSGHADSAKIRELVTLSTTVGPLAPKPGSPKSRRLEEQMWGTLSIP